jgi:CO/xanthine dehydrogenase Mo-binding subunit
MNSISSFSRRDLLRSGGALMVSFAFGGLSSPTASAQERVRFAGKPVDGSEVDSFLAIHSDGAVTVFTGKVDLGTGLRIAVRQMAAEELGLSASQVELIEGDTLLTADQGRTGGSSGLTQGGVGVRQAAATARELLINRAADQLKRPASDLVLAEGRVRPKSGGEGVKIGDLVGGKRLEQKVNPKVALKDPATYTVVGKSLPRPDVAGKCTGTQTFVNDFKLPGMLHGRVFRPPAMGAKLISVDESSISGIPGVRIVRVKDFLGVVAPNEWAAIRAASTLKAKWTEWNGLPGTEELPRVVRKGKIATEQAGVTRGNAKTAMATAAKRFSGTYYYPYQGHASMGPSCAVADFKPPSLTVWTGSQSTHLFRTIFSESFALPADKVRFIYLEGSGCYGQNGHEDAAADAAILSREVGSPVRVQWMRHDEHGWDPKGPPQLLDLRAGVDDKGNLVAWETETWVPVPIAAKGTIPLIGFDAAGITQRQGRWPGSVDENLDPPYKTDHVQVSVHRLQDSPLRPGHVRAPGKIANVFAVESLIDEIAVSAGEDSVAWRLRNLTDPRAVAVLTRAAELIGWEKRVSPNPKAAAGKLLKGRGVSYVRYRGNENYVAMAMEVLVDPATGKVKVERVTCGHDCGLVVNPDALKNQIEGSILQTLSKMLYEEVKLDTSRVTSLDWVSYPVLRFPDVPVIEISLLDRPTEPVMGGGEASLPPVGAALANAFFDATGVRLHAAPFTPERVKAALSKMQQSSPRESAAV